MEGSTEESIYTYHTQGCIASLDFMLTQLGRVCAVTPRSSDSTFRKRWHARPNIAPKSWHVGIITHAPRLETAVARGETNADCWRAEQCFDDGCWAQQQSQALARLRDAGWRRLRTQISHCEAERGLVSAVGENARSVIGWGSACHVRDGGIYSPLDITMDMLVTRRQHLSRCFQKERLHH